MSLPVITVHGGSLRFSVKPVFEGLDVNLLEDDHVCLIGRNGEGKSSLLKVLAGVYELDKGDIYRKPHAKIHYLPQDLDLPKQTKAMDIILEAAQEEYSAQIFLDALEVDGNRVTDDFSGGEKRRILLAKTLAGNPDVLLLDEPTNHLDIRAIQWLEGYLNQYRGALLMISHDRRFLANTAKGMLWLDRGAMRQTNQPYSRFDEWEEQITQHEQAEMSKIASKLRMEEHWRQYGVTARRKRNQGRLERLVQMRSRRKELLSNQVKSAQLSVQEQAAGSQCIAEAFDIKKEYPGTLSLGPFSTRIFKRDRIGIIGPNGAGKSTLLKMLIGELKPDSGRVRLGTSIDVAYFKQERETMDPELTPWQYLCPTGGDSVEVQGESMHVVGYLKKFLFNDEQARGRISILSGGEKNRLQLAQVLAQKSNVLILDEPTNDLDSDTLDLLLDMLTDYKGALIVISHDRDFLDQLVTAVFAIHPDGSVEECVGGYSDYEAQYGAKILTQKKQAKKIAKTVEKEGKETIATKKKLTYKDQRDFDLLPVEIEKLAKRCDVISHMLGDAVLYTSNPKEFEALSFELENAQEKIETMELRWLEVASLVE